MNIHNNARTAPNMRALIAGRRQAGETPRSIAGAVGVSPAAVRKWLRRRESEGRRVSKTGPAGRIACARGSHPSRSSGRSPAPEPSPFWKIAREAGLSRATVARIGKAKGLSRLSGLDPKIEIVRYEKK